MTANSPTVLAPGFYRQRTSHFTDAKHAAESQNRDMITPWQQAVRLRPDWRLAAACRYMDPDLFFPIGTAGPSAAQITRAKEVCRACPVRTPCLGWALERGVEHGVWGGMTEEERRALRVVIAGQRRPA
jgi:WhiB family transcriptional regulator, redox-sensing transcriptional regulator